MIQTVINRKASTNSKLKFFVLYVVTISLGLTVVSFIEAWVPIPPSHSLLFWCLLSLVTSLVIIKLPAGGGVVTSLGEIVDLASFITVGPVPILLSNLFSAYGRSILLRRKEPVRDLFNFSLWNFASLCSYYSFTVLHRSLPLLFNATTIGAILIAWLIYSVITTSHVSIIVALTGKHPIRQVWKNNYSRESLVSFISSPLALVMAVLYLHYGWIPVLILLLPLLGLSVMLGSWVEKARILAREERNVRLAEMGKVTASVVHEVSKPISRILVTSEFGLADGMSAKDALATIYDEANSARSITERFRSLDSVNIKPTQSRISDVVHALMRQLNNDGIPLRISDNIMTSDFVGRWDIDMLIVALHNLAKNAWESQNCEGLAPELIVFTTNYSKEPQAEGAGAEVTFIVNDQGPGIPLSMNGDAQEALFSTKETGFGIGLYLANQIAIAHGGRLEATNSTEGAEISLTIPQYKPH